MKNQIKVYVSHSIRGRKGMDATDKDMQANVNLAVIFGQTLRRKFPGIDFYVPGDHEFPPIGNLLRKKYITVGQILEIDCDIVRQCAFVVVFSPDGHLSRGMKIEIEYAGENGIPVIVIFKLDRTGTNLINRQIQELKKQGDIK